MDTTHVLAAFGLVPHDRQYRLALGLAALGEALADAGILRAKPQDFAVPLPELREAGLTGRDVRLLIASGLVTPARGGRTARAGRHKVQRSRSPDGIGRNGSPEPAFILAPAAATAVLAWTASVLASVNGGMPAPAADQPDVAHPRWDSDLRELWWGAQLVKQFRVPAPSQELILTSFEELRWVPRIDSPLPPDRWTDPGHRLHAAIRGLNRGHRRPLIVFRRDGTGEGIRWARAGQWQG